MFYLAKASTCKRGSPYDVVSDNFVEVQMSFYHHGMEDGIWSLTTFDKSGVKENQECMTVSYMLLKTETHYTEPHDSHETIRPKTMYNQNAPTMTR